MFLHEDVCVFPRELETAQGLWAELWAALVSPLLSPADWSLAGPACCSPVSTMPPARVPTECQPLMCGWETPGE